VYDDAEGDAEADDGGDVTDVEPDDDDDEEADEGDADDTPTPTNRSAYVGRGNVQEVRQARKRAGLSDGFPRSDPLLQEFASFERMAGAAEKDINNKVNCSTAM